MCAKSPTIHQTNPVNPPPAPLETVDEIKPSSAAPDASGLKAKRRGRSSLRITSDTGVASNVNSTGLAV